MADADAARRSGAAPRRPAEVEFFFDPMCPYAYQTSLWIRTVRERTGLGLRWRFFSLEEVNREDGKKHPWEREWSYGWSQMRIGALIRRQQGDDAVDRWYEAVGRAFHEDGRPTQHAEVHREVIVEAGFDGDLVEAAIADPTTGDEVRADHEWLRDAHGGFGVPTMVFPAGEAVYGPVVVPAPEGDEAEALWNLVVAYNAFPKVFELKHPKTGADLTDIASRFEPYLRARSWRTIENPAP
ncbi:MAG: DsbA family protein [Acidimicrobiales bacterium]